MTPLLSILIAGGIASLFLAPALLRPTLGRIVLSVMFVGGAFFNLLYTLPKTPGSLVQLVATAPIPPYREIIDNAVAWHVTPTLAVLVIVFEFSVGLLMVCRGWPARVALLGAGAWGLGMLPVIPPQTMLIGIALTGAPGLAGLILARHTYQESIVTIARSQGYSVISLVRALIQPVPAVLVFAALWVLFVFGLHPWFMNWGSTAEEQAMALPGDTAPPSTYFTRAVTIDAPPDASWPCLLAIGQDGAGFLSNDYLENLTGADIHNADTLRPEWQQRVIGDKVQMGSPGQRALFGDVTRTTIHILEPERVIADAPGRFVLLSQGASTTRLLLRESLDDPLRAGATWVLWDPIHFVMEQRMLQGIKERAEGHPFVPQVVQATAHLGWALAALAMFGLFVLRRGWRPWLVFPALVALPSLWFAGDVHSFLAAFLAIAITLAGFLAFGWRWLAPYLLVASSAALVLLLAPDNYSAFGLIFLMLVARIAGAFRQRFTDLPASATARMTPARTASSRIS